MSLLTKARPSSVLKSVHLWTPHRTVPMSPLRREAVNRALTDRNGPVASEWEAADFERFHDYLLLLARAAIGRAYQAKLAASDVVRRTLNDAYFARDQFRGTTDAELLAWLRQALKNNLRDEVRKLRAAKRDVYREVSIDQAVEESNTRLEPTAGDLTPDAAAELAEHVLRQAEAIVRLPQAQREIIELCYLAQLPIAEAASRIGRTEAAVGGLLNRALKRLRRELSE